MSWALAHTVRYGIEIDEGNANAVDKFVPP